MESKHHHSLKHGFYLIILQTDSFLLNLSPQLLSLDGSIVQIVAPDLDPDPHNDTKLQTRDPIANQYLFHALRWETSLFKSILGSTDGGVSSSIISLKLLKISIIS